MQNVREERRFKENLTILQKRLLKKVGSNLTINTNQSSTISSPRNENTLFYKKGNKDFAALYKLTFIDFNIIDLEQDSVKKKIRKDNFGHEIKKGGKHKIVFADELNFVKIDELDDIKDIEIKNNKIRRKESFNESIRNNDNEKIKSIRRFNSFDKSNKFVKKYFSKIYKVNNRKTKTYKFNNVDIIDFESTKKENKLNTYYLQKNLNFQDEGNVSCSCYCNIF